VVFKQGESGDKFYMVLRGTARFYINIPGTDEEKFLMVKEAGTSFGEIALLFKSNRNATIKVGANT
jgi:CRP-like cAMP-binding protein